MGMQVTVYRLVSKNTIEERILHRAKQKDSIQKMVISGDQASSAFKGGGNDSFKATDFADLLFEEDEEEDKEKAKLADAKNKLSQRSAPKSDAKMETDSKGAVEKQKGDSGHFSAPGDGGADLKNKCDVAVKVEGGDGAGSKMQVDGVEGVAVCTQNGTSVKDESSKDAAAATSSNGISTSAAAEAAPPPVDTTGASVTEGGTEELGEWLKVDNKVEVEWEGEWWECVVKKIIVTKQGKAGKVEIDYVGGDEQEAEWIDVTYTKLLGWVSTRMRELEPEPVPEPAQTCTDTGGKEGGGSWLKGAGLGLGSGGMMDTASSAAEAKARDQARLAACRSGPAIIMDMDD